MTYQGANFNDHITRAVIDVMVLRPDHSRDIRFYNIYFLLKIVLKCTKVQDEQDQQVHTA